MNGRFSPVRPIQGLERLGGPPDLSGPGEEDEQVSCGLPQGRGYDAGNPFSQRSVAPPDNIAFFDREEPPFRMDDRGLPQPERPGARSPRWPT
jgi:hypothetical protein